MPRAASVVLSATGLAVRHMVFSYLNSEKLILTTGHGVFLSTVWFEISGSVIFGLVREQNPGELIFTFDC
jgi:hypothetical protein